jgi:hypothetical protein
MKAALYVLGGVAATLAFLGFSVLLAWAFEGSFGSTYGPMVEMVVLFSLAGGYTGWLIYRMRLTAPPRDLEPRP